MERVRYNDSFIYVDDSPLDENETGKLMRDTISSKQENSTQLNVVSNEDILDDTITDLWGNSNE